ncbi:hypothetical protein BS47DRAFT_1415378, partial [Hydnum rufescens UP504]
MKLTRLGGLSLTQDQIMTLGKSMGNEDAFLGAYVAVKNALRPLDRELLLTNDIYGVRYYLVTTQIALHEFGDRRLHDPIPEGKYEVPIRELMRRHGVDDVKFVTIIQQYRPGHLEDSSSYTEFMQNSSSRNQIKLMSASVWLLDDNSRGHLAVRILIAPPIFPRKTILLGPLLFTEETKRRYCSTRNLLTSTLSFGKNYCRISVELEMYDLAINTGSNKATNDNVPRPKKNQNDRTSRPMGGRKDIDERKIHIWEGERPMILLAWPQLGLPHIPPSSKPRTRGSVSLCNIYHIPHDFAIGYILRKRRWLYNETERSRMSRTILFPQMS